MNPNTTTSIVKGAPRSPRAMVALVVLTEHLPMPARISFQGKGVAEPGSSIMAMSFRTVAEGQAWSRHLGGRTDTYVNTSSGRAYLDEGPIRWHGWFVQLHASDNPTRGRPLDAATATQLATIAGGDEK